MSRDLKEARERIRQWPGRTRLPRRRNGKSVKNEMAVSVASSRNIQKATKLEH